MPDLKKLEVMILERHQEPVNLFLCSQGVAQYIKVDCEKEYSGLLNACPIPKDESLKNSDIQTRIKTILDKYDLKPYNGFDHVALLPGSTIIDILSNMEQKLIDIEEQISEATLSKKEALSNEQTSGAMHSKAYKDLEEKIKEILETRNREYSEDHSDKNIPSRKKKKEYEANGDIIHQVFNLRKNRPVETHSIEDIPETGTIHSTLLALLGMTLEIDILLEIEHDMAHCGSVVYFEAWILAKEIPKIITGIEEITNGTCVIELEKPKPEDNVPNVIKESPLLFEGFEKLTFSLGYPRKGEINPTYMMAFTFPFLFGIMFADVGQGIILFLMGIFLLRARKKADMNKVGEIAGYFLQAAGIITLCGIGAIFFGFLFGEFFGPSGVLNPILLFEIGPFKFGGFDPVHEPLTLLRFTILIGVSFITWGLLLSVVNHIKRRDWSNVITYLCWIWFLLGGFTMWVYYGGISKITVWFAEGLPMFLMLVIIPLIIMLLVTAKAENFMEGVDLAVEAFIESLGHTLSFCRLAALFLTHTALNTMFLDLGGVDVVNGIFPLGSIPLIAVGTLLALFIEGLLVMVHCLRLHWIEILPKFYSGKGILFKPINIQHQI